MLAILEVEGDLFEVGLETIVAAQPETPVRAAQQRLAEGLPIIILEPFALEIELGQRRVGTEHASQHGRIRAIGIGRPLQRRCARGEVEQVDLERDEKRSGAVEKHAPNSLLGAIVELAESILLLDPDVGERGVLAQEPRQLLATTWLVEAQVELDE